MGPVFVPWAVSMQTFSRILEVLFQHKQGGMLVLDWADELTEGRRILVQTGQASQLQWGGLSRRQPHHSTSVGTVELTKCRSGAAMLTGSVGSHEVLCFSLWNSVPHCKKSLLLLYHLMSKALVFQNKQTKKATGKAI